jgi:phage FluMu gp28-like protein
MPTEAPAKPRGRPYPKQKQVSIMQDKQARIEPVTPWRPFQTSYIRDPNRLIFCVKGAQIGVSTASAAWAVGECIARENHLVIILSRSEPQAKELARKAKLLVDKLKGVEAHLSEGFFQNTLILEHTIKFPNGSRIIALSSNPETARGYTGDVVLDEFAFHPQSADIFKAAYRQITLGFRMRIISTPNGQQGKFYEMAQKLGVADGVEPKALKEARARGDYYVKDGWSLHYIDIFHAVQDGFPVDPKELRAGCDDDTWLQEYNCHFQSTAQQWIPPELMDAPNIDTLVTQDIGRLGNNPPMHLRNLYAGWDVARHKDLSVVWFNELVGDIAVCRGIFEMSKRPTPDQIEEARQFLRQQPGDDGKLEPPVVQRMCIDTGSMGLTMYETLLKEFGSGQIEGVTFTLQHKEAMAVESKRRMEERKVRIPDLPAVRNSFRMVKKVTTATGQARFDSEHDEKWGHCYDDQTELLTLSGWRRFDHLSVGDMVASLRGEELVFEPCSAVQHYEYNGEMVGVLNQQVDLLVTPNHAMYARVPGLSGGFRKLPAGTLIGSKARIEYKKGAVWRGAGIESVSVDGHHIPAKAWMRFLGLFLSEGFTSTANRVGITQKEIEGDSFIMDCVRQLPWRFHVERGGQQADSVRTKSKGLWQSLRPLGKAPEKYVPPEVLSLSSDLLRELFDGMMHGDGHRGEENWCYYSSSRRLADDFQALLLRIGMAGTVVPSKPNPKAKNIETLWRVNINRTRLTPQTNKRKLEHFVVPYSGPVHCCTVPSGLLYVRRNGKPCWSGNSDHWWAMCLAHAAESGSALHPLMLYWQQQVAGRQAAEAAQPRVLDRPAQQGLTISETKALESVTVPPVLGEAQKEELSRRGLFGAEKWPVKEATIVQMAQEALALRRPQVRSKPVCANCGNAQVGVYGEVVICNRCNWKGTR